MVPAVDASLAEVIAESFRAERRTSAVRLGTLRFAAITVFFALQLFLGVVLALPSWDTNLVPFAVYWVAAGGLYVLGQRSETRALPLVLAIPILDTPMAAVLLGFAMQKGSTEGTSSFGVGIFAFLTALSALSLRKRLIFAQMGVAMAAQVVLYRLAHVGVGSMVAAVVVIGLVAAICVFLVGRIVSLVETASGEQARRENLARYFSPAVATLVGAVGGVSRGEVRDLSVLFCDIRGFTRISERLPGPEVVAFLNDYLTRMIDVVFEHGGTLDKCMGDRLLVYFGAPISHEDHAERAVRCALAMQDAVTRFNAERPAEDAIRVGVGIHSGAAVVGSIGSPRRREYTVVGETVNLASHIEGLTRRYHEGVLVSQETRHRALAEFDFEPQPAAIVSGRAEPVLTFAPRQILSERAAK